MYFIFLLFCMSATIKDIVQLCQARGFVYQGSEIYGGLANSWDYGPYGSLLKENLKNLWIKEFVQKRTDMVLIDSSIILNPRAWVASGHVGGFCDPLIDDKITKERFRADKLLEDHIQNLWEKADSLLEKYSVSNLIPESWSLEKQTEVMRAEKIANPNTGKPGDWSDAKQFNLMFETSLGVTADSSSKAYLRPETAQGIFLDFPNVLRTSRRKLPFGIAQIGKAFRNEITPGNFIFRTREFEQMEIEYFCEPGTDLQEHAHWKEQYYNFFAKTIGIREENLRFRDHDADELSHYSAATSDIEYKFSFGWWELCGIADRTDFDLKAHMTESKQDMSYFDPVNNKKVVPYVIEPSVGLNRLFLVTLCDAYCTDWEGEEKRTYLKLDPKVAPIKVGVLPVVKKIGNLAKEIYAQLSGEFMCEYDEVGSIGKRYARFDEIGTPFCVTIDSENYDAGNVTVRERDSMEQEVVAIAELNEYLRAKMQ